MGIRTETQTKTATVTAEVQVPICDRCGVAASTRVEGGRFIRPVIAGWRAFSAPSPGDRPCFSLEQWDLCPPCGDVVDAFISSREQA